MDINKIFGAFDSSSFGGSNTQYSPPQKNTFIDENSPSYKLGMFRKLIINYTTYAEGLLGIMESSSPKLDVDEVKRASEGMLYSRAFDYIKDIDLQKKEHINALFREAKVDLELALNKSLDHFESLEEYEKCAILKKYLDFLNFSS